MDRILIFPCNGNAFEALDCLSPDQQCIGYIDDDPLKLGKDFFDLKVHSREMLNEDEKIKVLAVPGNPDNFQSRKELINGLRIKPERFCIAIHPSAVVSARAKIGKNVLIMAGVVITSNAVIGDHVCILPNSVVHHDVSINNYTLIGAGVVISGNTVIGKNCYIGSGSRIRNNLRIGDNSLIGMGSNVIKTVADHSVVAGNPARKIRE